MNDASNDGYGDTVYYVRTKYVMDWIEKYSHAHPSTLFVVEGIWMMYCCAPEYFRSKPIIVMGTSIAKSEYRRALRDGNSNKYRRNKYSYTSKDKIRKDFVDALLSYTSGSAKESAEIISPAEESYIFNKQDYEQNLDKWKIGESNILFITGLSGSGKSTLSKKLAKENNAIRFEMDGLSHGFDTSNAGILDKLKERNPEYKRAVETHWKPSEKSNLILRNEKRYLLQTVAKDLIKICQDDKDNLYIIEGIQIFGLLNPSYFTDKPVIIKGTSAMTSYFRAVKREGIGNCIKAILDGEQIQLTPKIWIDDEKLLSDFKKGATESTYDEEPAEESYIFNKRDYEQNLDKWKPGEFNTLFITGHSGSGKSTLAEKLEKEKHAIMFELDGLEHNFDSSNKGILDKLKARNPTYKYAVENKWPPSEKDDLIIAKEKIHLLSTVAKDLVMLCREDKEHLYIIEGIQIFQWLNPGYFKNKPLIIKGTSMIQSYLRAAKREGGIKNLDGFNNWTRDEKMIRDFGKHAKESVEIISPAEESYVFSGKDYEQNLDKWNPGKNNILFITGLSGSGKTTLAKDLGKDKPAIVFEIDGLARNYDSSNMGILAKIKERYPEYKRAVESKWATTKGSDVVLKNERTHMLQTVTKSLIDLCHADSKNLYIIEGLQIYMWLNPEYIKDQPVIIKGTSATQSFIRAINRAGFMNCIKNIFDSENPKFRFAFGDWVDSERLLKKFKDNVTVEDEPAEESIQLHTNFDKVKVKGTLSLSKFTKIRITQEILEKYKEKCASFGHCRVSNMSKGYLYVDKKDNIVGFVNVVKKPDGIKWIQALNIQPEYQGYGLYEQLLKVAVRELGGTDISAPPKNDTAKELYRKFGFRTYTDEESVHAMSIRADAQRVKYDAKAKPNATNMTEAGLYPVFVMLTHVKKGFGRVVKFMTHAPYSHASISFDSSMDRLYSFASRDGHTMIPLGMATESLDQYKKSTKDAIFTLYVKLVDKEDKDLMERKVKEMYNRRTEFRYDIPGVVKNFFGQRSANEKRYFCSGFVAYILNSGKRQVTDKPSDMMRPMDIPDIQYIHLVDMGLVRDYDKNYVDKKVDQIFKKHYMNKEKDSHKQPIDEDKKGEK